MLDWFSLTENILVYIYIQQGHRAEETATETLKIQRGRHHSTEENNCFRLHHMTQQLCHQTFVQSLSINMYKVMNITWHNQTWTATKWTNCTSQGQVWDFNLSLYRRRREEVRTDASGTLNICNNTSGQTLSAEIKRIKDTLKIM